MWFNLRLWATVCRWDETKFLGRYRSTARCRFRFERSLVARGLQCCTDDRSVAQFRAIMTLPKTRPGPTRSTDHDTQWKGVRHSPRGRIDVLHCSCYGRYGEVRVAGEGSRRGRGRNRGADWHCWSIHRLPFCEIRRRLGSGCQARCVKVTRWRDNAIQVSHVTVYREQSGPN